MAAREKTDRKPVTGIAVTVEFAKRLRFISIHRNLTIPEVLEEYATAVIDREYRKVLKERHELGGEAG